MIGLGKMGGNMATRLVQKGISVVGFDRSAEIVKTLEENAKIIGASSVKDAVTKLEGQKIIWLMVPAGNATEEQINELIPMLNKGEKGIGFMDCGTSGGVWGLANGYCLMVGAKQEVADTMKPILQALAHEDRGWAHVGPVGSGHFTKMIHNGIEYGMMESFAEGLELLKGKSEFKLDLAQITELWKHGSVVRSWLLDLTADALKEDQSLDEVAPYVADSGEGRWTVVESIEQGIPTPVLTLALQVRFRSQERQGYGYRLLSVMRNAFGGHVVKKTK